MKAAAFVAFALAALYNAFSVLGLQLGTSPYRVPTALGDMLAQNSSAYQYPTDLTRNIVPKQLHSHNDYWRDVPFFSALSVGAISVEADVWLYNGTLYVGHEEQALTPARTFKALYVDPILHVLNNANPSSPFVNATSPNGVFDTDSSQTLYLWVDMKTNGLETYPVVHSELEPIRAAGYLTTYSKSGGMLPGPVTVIGTGNTPLSSVEAEDPRDVFYDAHLPDLNSTLKNITSDITPIASTDFMQVFSSVEGGANRTGVFSEAQLNLLNAQVKYAYDKGIGARYWDTPGWPVSTRNKIWATLWEAGVALINVDDLIAGAGYADQANLW